MLSTSAAFKAAVAENSNVKFKATLTLASGTTMNLTEADVMEGSQSYSEGVTPDGSFDIGAAIMGKFNFTLFNYEDKFSSYDFEGATITPYVGVKIGNSTEWLKKGVYGVEQPNTYGTVISLSSLDNMRKFERDYAEVTTTYPASLSTILRAICNKCGVTLGTSTFPNQSYVVNKRPDATGMSCLDMVSYIAQLAGCWAKCDNQGRLTLGWYDKDFFDTTPTEGTYANIVSLSSMSVYTDDVVVTGVRMTASDEITEDGGNGEKGETYLYGTEGYVVDLSGNPLCEYGKAQTCATFIGQRTVGLRFRPFQAAAIGDPSYEAGDPAIITDAKGVQYKSYISTLTYQPGSYEQFACNAEYPGRNKAASYTAVTKALVAAKNAVYREQTAREIAIQNLEEQIIEGAAGLYMTAEQQPDQSYIYYMHDQPTLAESQIVWKLTANAFAVSLDGGTTYPYGLDANGDAILNRIYAIGLDADYIDTGALTVSKNGVTLFNVDMDTGAFHIQDASGDNSWDSNTGFTMRGNTAESIIDQARKQIGGTNLLIDSNAPSLAVIAADAPRKFVGDTNGITKTITSISTADRPAPGVEYKFKTIFSSNRRWYTSGLCFYDGKSVPMVDGQQYTVSCWAKCVNGYSAVYFQLEQDERVTSARLNLSSAWRKFSFTFEFKQSAVGGNSGARVIFWATPTAATETIVEMAGFKLEVGAMATDWSQSPQDITYALKKAKEDAKRFAKDEAAALDNTLNQEKVFKRLMTKPNGGLAQGLVLNDKGELYINGTYIQSDTINANVIKTGILADKEGKNSWNLRTGAFKTTNGTLKDCTISGRLTTVTDTKKAVMHGGNILLYTEGISNKKNREVPVLSIIPERGSGKKGGVSDKAVLYSKEELELVSTGLWVGNWRKKGGKIDTKGSYATVLAANCAIKIKIPTTSKGKFFTTKTAPGSEYGGSVPSVGGTWKPNSPKFVTLTLAFINGICTIASVE